jgi:hypothetical protein
VRVFIRRCAWHTKYHGYSKILGITWTGWGIQFSHGICSDCAARTRAEWRLPAASEPAPAPEAPRRPLRSLRPDFALAAAVMLLAVTATFAFVGVPGSGSRTDRQSAALERTAIDENSAPQPSSSPATPPASTDPPASTERNMSAASGAKPAPPAPAPSAPAGSMRAAPTPGSTLHVADAPARESSGVVSSAGRSNRSRVVRVRARGGASGAGVIPVSAPEQSSYMDDRGRLLAASHIPAAVVAPGPSNFGLSQIANHFNDVQAP